jgi:hypothetical protein
MPTDISSPLKTKFSRADRYDRVFQRSEYKFKLPKHGTAPNFPFTNGQIFKFELLKHVTALNFLFMLKLPRPSLFYHPRAHRQGSLQLLHGSQICRPWCRPCASQQTPAFTHPSKNSCTAHVLAYCFAPWAQTTAARGMAKMKKKGDQTKLAL